MEEFFKGLLERARYYEEFENFRVSGFSDQARKVQNLDPKKTTWPEYPKVSP